jgi:hypothetical protein
MPRDYQRLLENALGRVEHQHRPGQTAILHHPDRETLRAGLDEARRIAELVGVETRRFRATQYSSLLQEIGNRTAPADSSPAAVTFAAAAGELDDICRNRDEREILTPVAVLIDNADLLGNYELYTLLLWIKGTLVKDLPVQVIVSVRDRAAFGTRCYRLYPDSEMMFVSAEFSPEVPVIA